MCTEAKRIRDQLSASHERFTTVLEGLDAAVSVVSVQQGELLFANRSYRLEQVATVGATLIGIVGMPEVVETHGEHVGQRLKGADVAAQIPAVGRVEPVGLDHHGHRVPAHVRAQAALQLQVARVVGLFRGFDGVHIPRRGRKGHVHAVLTRLLEQLRRMEPLPSRLTCGGIFAPSCSRYMPLMICSSVPALRPGWA